MEANQKLKQFFRLINDNVDMHLEEGDVHLARNAVITAGANLFMHVQEHGEVPQRERESLKAMASKVFLLAAFQYAVTGGAKNLEMSRECGRLGSDLDLAIEAASIDPSFPFPYKMGAEFS